MINHTSHTHPLYKQDNASVFTMIEEASCGTHFSNTIQPFKIRKDGQGTWLALILSHMGDDKWEIITKLNSAWLMTTKWNGKNTHLSFTVPTTDQNTPNLWKLQKMYSSTFLMNT